MAPTKVFKENLQRKAEPSANVKLPWKITTVAMLTKTKKQDFH
jgi:hypothetical protein